MLFFFLSAIMFLCNGIPLDKIVVRNQTASNVLSDFSAPKMLSVLLKDKDPKAFVDMLSGADPAQIQAVVALVEELIAASQLDLDTVTLASTNANTNYVDATNALNAAEAEKANLETQRANTITTRDAEVSAIDTALNQQATIISAAETSLSEATGAKTEAQATLDAEKARLENEIVILRQVIALLEGLSGNGGASSSIVEARDGRQGIGWGCMGATDTFDVRGGAEMQYLYDGDHGIDGQGRNTCDRQVAVALENDGQHNGCFTLNWKFISGSKNRYSFSTSSDGVSWTKLGNCNDFNSQGGEPDLFDGMCVDVSSVPSFKWFSISTACWNQEIHQVTWTQN